MAANHVAVEYRNIPMFAGYRVGNDGSVWFAWVTTRAGRRLTDRWRPMKLAVNGRGYHTVNLTPPGGKYRTLRVHRLVLETFVGPCPPGGECRHLNGVKTDNRLSNLVWGTSAENAADNRRLGTQPIGQLHPMHKLTTEHVRSIRSRYADGGVLMRELAVEFGINVSNVSAIINRRTWQDVE